MTRYLSLVLLAGCIGGPELVPDEVEKAAGGDTILTNVKLTHYTLVREEDTSGQHTGNTQLLCSVQGLSGCYHKEFLCSGWGVAMQGTGISSSGRYIKYLSGGGGWTSGNTWLASCASARFTTVATVAGAAGRSLVDDYSIAVDPAVIPLGRYVWIDSEGHWFRADDTGGYIDGRHIDIYAGLSGGAPAASRSRIYVTSTPHHADDPSPYAAAPVTEEDCGGLDYAGTCSGGVLRWCEGGTQRAVDCTAAGKVCGYQDASVGYNCLAAATTVCGDGVCAVGETVSSCVADCAAAPACGDGVCAVGETVSSCAVDCAAASTCDVAGHLGAGANNDPCAEAEETWRCVTSASFATTVSQVCRDGRWLNYHLDPASCESCCGEYSSSCS